MDTTLERLFRHLAWADAQVLDLLARTPGAPPEALRLLGHLVQTESIWLGRVQGTAAGAARPWPDPPLALDRCRAMSLESLEEFRKVLAASGPDALAAPVAYRTSRGEPFATPLLDILLHVALHGAYHRGQVALLLRRGGIPPAPTDYILLARLED